MKTSLIIRTRNEGPRLRLMLASLERQSGLHEVVVVDDGSTDETPRVIAEAADRLPLVTVRHELAHGRSAASNAGARAATGDLLVFLDGDTLAGHDMILKHVAAHNGGTASMGRGETWHLRCTRFLSDPETGEKWPHEGARAPQASAAELAAMCVTRAQIRDQFDAIERRASPGIYPGAAPRRLYEMEMEALLRQAAAERLWAAASGSNLSVPRSIFLDLGGFDPEIDINEHRELAYRACRTGARMLAVPGARSYHLTHRSGWRDPLEEAGWEHAFRRKHPEAPITLLKEFWHGLGVGASAPAFFDA